ncbi:hypothetical protein RHSIM_Rhsim05G0100600 [Rhododendron simsii]|uniref:NAC domain-containing protein n=1 Tax=Rhododendron simsii TaxID=118357 RepID=A0A834H8C3_RHOSS|nr:hypothetical protein RHSIM_Rhsim05G0100600 [Rhododendron simsii]
MEPSPICSVSSNMHVQQDPETIWLLKNMPWPENSVPQHAGEINLLWNEITDESLKECHWIMYEYFLPVGNATNGKGKYVLCRIKRDDPKDTKISPRKRKNVEAATTDHDDLAVPKPSKRVRTKLVQEQKMECDSVVALEPEVVPFSEEPVVQDQSFIKIGDPHEFTLEDMDEVLRYLIDEQVPVEEQQESFVLDNDYDDFCNILLPTEVDPLGLALASSVQLLIETSEDNGQQYLNPSHIMEQNLPNVENLCSGDQESDLFLTPITRFHATTEPWPIYSLSSNMHVQEDPQNPMVAYEHVMARE